MSSQVIATVDSRFDIAEHMASNDLNTWGFVFVRATYTDDELFQAFMSEVKREILANFTNQWLKDRLKWTIIESKETLDGKRMFVASETFKKWVDSEEGGRAEANFAKESQSFFDSKPEFPRYRMYVYVDEASIASVIDTKTYQPRPRLPPVNQINRSRGHHLVLVRADVNLSPEDNEEDGEEYADESFLWANVNALTHYFTRWLDIDIWWDDCTPLPPYVHGIGG